MRLPIQLNDLPTQHHDYDVYVDMPQALAAKGSEAIITVYANNRDQAARIAHKAGYLVRSVNMVG
jgi:hypothetical protein